MQVYTLINYCKIYKYKNNVYRYSVKVKPNMFVI